MAGLARRLAPAAALGGLAVVAVGVLDPAFAGRETTGAVGSSATSATATRPQGNGAKAAEEQDATTPDQGTGSAGASTDCDSGEEVTGDSAMTRWGPVQVAATVAGDRLCEVHAIVYPDGDPRSQQINAYAIPQLDRSASQNGAEFDYVSGATYTSMGYAQSLQSILDSL